LRRSVGVDAARLRADAETRAVKSHERAENLDARLERKRVRAVF
jgi:hypothetical protein